MEGDIKGFSISLGLDTSDIDRGMANLQRKLKTSNAQMKANLSSFKDAEESVEKYGTKIEGLNKQLTQQGRIVEKSKQKLDHLKNSQSQMSDKLEQAAKASKQAQANYKSLEKTYESMNNELKEHTNKVKEAQNTQKQIQNTVTQLSAKTKNAKGSFDVLNKEFKELKASGSASKQELTQLGNKVKEASLTYKSLSASLDSAKTDLNESKAATAQAKNELQDFKQANEGAMASAKASMQVAKKEAQSAERSYASLNREMAQLPSKIDKATAAMFKEIASFNALEHEIDEANDELDEFQRKQRGFGKMFASLGNFGDNFGKVSEKVNQIGDSFRNVGYIVSGTVQGTIIANLSTIVPVAGSAVSAIAGIGGAATAAAGGAVALGGAFGIAGAGAYAMVGMSKRALKMLEDDMLKATTEVKNYQKSLKGIQQEFDALVRSNQAHIFNTMTNGINAARFGLSQLAPAISDVARVSETFSAGLLNWVKNSQNAKTMFQILRRDTIVIFTDLTSAAQNLIDAFAAIFNKLSPLFTWASAGFVRMAASFNQWANSVQGSQAIQGFVNYTKTNLPIVGSIFGNIFGGIVSLFKAFSGHSHKVLVGMQQVTETFRNWANNLAGTKEFKSFIAYLEANGPVVWQLLKNIGMIAVGVIKGLAPVGSVMLKIATALTGLVAKVTNAHPAIGALMGVMSALVGSFMVLSPQIILLTTVLKTLGVTSMLTSLKTKLLNGTLLSTVKNSRLVTGAMKAMRVAATFMLGPWGLVIAGVVALGAALVTAYKKSETFRNIVNGAFNSVKNVAMMLWKWLSTAFNGIKQMFIGNFAQGNFILNQILPKWAVDGIRNGILMISGAFQSAVTFISGVVGKIKTLFTGILTMFSGKFAAGNSILAKILPQQDVNRIRYIILMIRTMFINLFNFFRTKIQALTAFFKAFWQTHGATIKFYLRMFFGLVVTAFNKIKSAIGTALNFIFNAIIKPVLKGIWNKFKIIFGGIKNIVVIVFNHLKNIIRAGLDVIIGIINVFRGVFTGNWKLAWKGLVQIVSGVFRTIWSTIKSAFQIIVTIIRTSLNLALNIVKTLWTAIKNVFVGVARAIWNGVKGHFVRLVVGVKSQLNNLKAGVTVIWSLIKKVIVNAAIGIWTGVKKFFGLARTVALTIFRGLGKILGTIWNGIKKVIIFAAKSIWTGIKKFFGLARQVAVSIFKGLGGILGAIWRGISRVVVAAAKFVWSGIKKWFTLARKVTLNIFKGVGSFLGKIWNGIKNTVVNVVKNIVISVRKKWKDFLLITKYRFNQIKVFLVKIWLKIKRTIVKYIADLIISTRKKWKDFLVITKYRFNQIKAYLYRVWSRIKDTIVKTVSRLWSGVKKIFSNLYKGTKNIFNSVRNWLYRTWNNIKNKIVAIASKMWSGIKRIFTNLYKGTRDLFNRVRNWLIKTWNNIKSKVTRIIQNMWNGVKRVFTNLWKGTKNIFSKLRNWLIDNWSSIKNKITGIASSLWSKVKGTFNKMRDGIKNIIGKIKGTVKNMIDAVKKGINALIKGVNWVGGKLGMPKIKPLELSTGTTHTVNRKVKTTSDGSLKEGTFATVGDKGPGNGPKGFRHETLESPSGRMFMTPNRDTNMFIPKGFKVHNGASTYASLHNGTLPQLSLGTVVGKLLGGGKKPKKQKDGDEAHGDAPGVMGLNTVFNAGKVAFGAAKDTGAKKLADTTANVAKAGNDIKKKVVKGSADLAAKTYSTASKGKKWLEKSVKDVMDYLENPGKLLEKVLSAFGVNFDGLNGMPLFKDMMGGAFKKLKKYAIDTFTKWMEDQSGDGGYIDLSKGINFGFARTAAEAAAQGYPFPRAHHGLDINYKHDKVYSTLSGTATAKHGWNGGFGNSVWIDNGKGLQAIYGHMHKMAFNGSKKVRPGDYLGISGGDPSEDGQGAGSSTGLHLHYEMRRNGQPFDPTNWLKTNNGGGKSGGKKAPSAWRSTIERAAKKMKVNPTKAQVDGIIAQIQRESGGDAGITQSTAVWDINAQTGNLAKGLLQYVPSTFRNFSVKGHNNILSGYDQLLAFFNNSNWANDIQYGRSGWGPRGHRRFATGGLIKNAGWYNIAEGGYPEWLIPTDPNRRTDAMKLLALAAKDIEGRKARGNKRPSQFSSRSVNNSSDNTELLLRMIENQQQQINVLMDIARSNANIEEKPTGILDRDLEQAHNRYQDKRERQKRRKSAFAGGAF
ncbi:peptidoglycan DD-metalloendopeptidase family protein [Staphylococcus massiliensis]|uniref:peptidoglycan DD-metalloendopeptidase family protein n=1 Tax=Staphylococcus massiliensis TaxID=555791 RepID=UPI001EDD3E02|nr:peptidoglycan DD-metalloendopeptidase family protein [Staphylococcus massiliensis]MCG3401687.1 peptidoglycan DD-metalloendopeptidase family protein [Staphylococcus massiliensis]